MSQPLQLPHPKKTSSLWWFNHMLTSWQKSAPAPTASPKAAQPGRHCAPTKTAVNQKSLLGRPSKWNKWLRDNIFHTLIITALIDHTLRVFRSSIIYIFYNIHNNLVPKKSRPQKMIPKQKNKTNIFILLYCLWKFAALLRISDCLFPLWSPVIVPFVPHVENSDHVLFPMSKLGG